MAADKAEGMDGRVAAIKQEDCDWRAPASIVLEEGPRRISGFGDKIPEEQVIVEIKVEDSEEFSVRLGLQTSERGAVHEDGHSSSQPWFASAGQMGAQQNCWEMKPEICEIDVEITEENGREGDEQPSSRRVRKNFQENGGFSTSSFAPTFLQHNEKRVKSTRRLDTFSPASLQCRSLPSIVPDQLREHKYVKVQAGEKPSCCSECGKPLHTHTGIHGGEKPHGCSECGKRFSQVSPLQGHMSIHLGAKCGKRFLDGGSLQRLTQSHAGEKPYCGSKGGKPTLEISGAAFCDDEDDDDDDDYFDDEVEDKTWAPGGDDLETSEEEAAQQHFAKKIKSIPTEDPFGIARSQLRTSCRCVPPSGCCQYSIPNSSWWPAGFSGVGLFLCLCKR
ncbi:zinc finger protein 232-like [Erpetoichthys calabaricus]|uniref:zinc finger protein 232-like n=1 Tax=Erpetoichthys calabaricus TaxID=27687 RepID=UPI002234B828|nr:zinc finger protein 232-like [Erpetoichthys calabaricus]